MSLQAVRKALKPCHEENGVFGDGDRVYIPTEKSVYKGIDICCSVWDATPAYLEYLESGKYRKIEENVFESEETVIVIVEKKAYEFGCEWERLTHENFLKSLKN